MIEGAAKRPKPPTSPSQSDQLAFVLNRLEELEGKLDTKEASLEDAHRNLVMWDMKVALAIRVFALIGALCVLVFLGFVVVWGIKTSHYWPLPFLNVPQGYAIALVTAPIVSITTITGGLLAAAFVRKREQDIQTATDTILDAVKNQVPKGT